MNSCIGRLKRAAKERSKSRCLPLQPTGRVMTTAIFSTVCLLGAIGWAALTTYVLMFAGWGDGATIAPSNTARAVAYLPSAYLLLLFAAGFRRVPVGLVRSILVAAYFVLAVFTY